MKTIENIAGWLSENRIEVCISAFAVCDNYFVKFRHLGSSHELKRGMSNMLEGGGGRGSTPELAVRDLLKKCSGRTLVFDSRGDDRKELVFPLVLTLPRE